MLVVSRLSAPTLVAAVTVTSVKHGNRKTHCYNTTVSITVEKVLAYIFALYTDYRSHHTM